MCQVGSVPPNSTQNLGTGKNRRLIRGKNVDRYNPPEKSTKGTLNGQVNVKSVARGAKGKGQPGRPSGVNSVRSKRGVHCGAVLEQRDHQTLKKKAGNISA